MICPALVRGFCLLLSIAASASAGAQTAIYRCGPDGRQYSSTPCTDGKALDAADARSAEQQRQAQVAARREAVLADKLAAERRLRDAAPRKSAARLDAGAIAPVKSASMPMAKKPKKKSTAPGDPRLSPPMRAASAAR